MSNVHTFWPKASISSTEISVSLDVEANEISGLVIKNQFLLLFAKQKSSPYHCVILCSFTFC